MVRPTAPAVDLQGQISTRHTHQEPIPQDQVDLVVHQEVLGRLDLLIAILAILQILMAVVLLVHLVGLQEVLQVVHRVAHQVATHPIK